MNLDNPAPDWSASATARGTSLADLRLEPGHTRVLGAQVEGAHINFALAAPHADAVELCLFDSVGATELARLGMPGRSDGIWHGRLVDSGGGACPAGLVYGWRVHGPWAPERGHRFNPAKLLLDPCAREVLGRYRGEDIHLGHDPSEHDPSARPDRRDNAALALKARVVGDLPPLAVPRPIIDPARRVIYELHVKGFTAAHPQVPSELRGSYAGLAHPAVISHLTRLGVTTVSLMPIAVCADEARLVGLGLTNYWGYNPIAWDAPDPRYWSGRPGTSARGELRGLVDTLHAAGFEVVLDVVYNHSAENNELGPTLSLRGIDNALYYHLLAEDQRRYANWTGCGNCVNLDEPLVLRTVMDGLRRWVSEFGVDGFRFDLAPVLARGGPSVAGAFQHHAPLLGAIAQDPILRERLMIAEPWDIGPGGYQVGQFPPGWLEWNDQFRDGCRAFWLQRQGTLGKFAFRLSGSSDLFHPAQRGAHTSVNFVTAHDGFTLTDLVSYSMRHNDANGEESRDGSGHNLSINNGVEGESDDPAVLAARARQKRTLLATLFLSLGTPMMLAGDEIGQTQLGNNNAYCQDNATTWLNWSRADAALFDFVARVLALRRAHSVLGSAAWWQSGAGAGGPVAVWFSSEAAPLTGAQWDSEYGGALALQLSGTGAGEGGDSVLLLINRGDAPVRFTLPPGRWLLEIDTSVAHDAGRGRVLASDEEVAAGSLWVALANAAPESDA